MKVKICGITRLADAQAAIDFGADVLGFIFARESPRFLPKAEIKKITAALPPFVTTVGVFTEGTAADFREAVETCGIDMIQFHGSFPTTVIEPFRERAICVVPIGGSLSAIKPAPARAYLVDIPRTSCDIRTPFDWNLALPVKKWGNMILAGGLTPENVQEAIDTVRPYAVDVCSGVEKEKGKKDYDKLKRFIDAAKRA